MMRTGIVLLLAAAVWSADPAAQQPTKGAAAQQSAALDIKPWTGDFDGMLQRRRIRVLVTHSKTYYYVERGQQRGIVYEAAKAFEDELNKKHPSKLRTYVVFVPMNRGEVLKALLEGRGDIIASGVTIPSEREDRVDFSIPTTTKPIAQIVVTGPKSPALNSVDDLAGKEVFVRKNSTYWASLEALNKRFASEQKPAIVLRPAPEDLEDEDMLEMLNAGLVNLVVVNELTANTWTPVYKAIKPRPDLAVRTDGAFAWVFRPNSPKLKAEVDAFLKTHRQGTTFGNTLIKRYTGSTRALRSATDQQEIKKFQALIELFRKYGAQYEMDFLLMMAQGYQESRLDQTVKSRVGAVGVMQVMPATGKELKVGDISQLESNIHAGVKYIRFMVDQYFAKEPMTQVDKGLFAFASYNAGPARVRQLRAEAAKRGLDPNVWFNNVEVVAADRIGPETVTYVSNIYKYYIAYRLVLEDMERDKARKPQG